MHARVTLATTLLVLVLVLEPLVASAQTASHAAVDYQAPRECPDRGHLDAALRENLGRPNAPNVVASAIASVARHVGVRIDHTAEGDFVATLDFGHGALRAVRNNDCHALVEAVAAVIAVSFDEPLASSDEPRPPTPHAEPEANAADRRQASHSAPPPPLVSVRSSTSDLSLHVLRGWSTAAPLGAHGAQWERVCASPCSASLQPDAYSFAVGRGADAPVAIPHLVRVSGPTTLDLRYTSHAARRTAGWIVYAVAAALLIVDTTFALHVSSHREPTTTETALALGLGAVGLAGGVLGIVWAARGDDASIVARPAL